MCIADIRLGRQTGSRVTTVSVTTTAAQLVPQSLNRVCLIISAPTGNRITISEDPNVLDGAGLVLYASGAPFTLDIQRHGTLVTRPLFAVTDTGTITIGYAEVTLLEQ